MKNRLELLEELRAMATTGLNFARSPYDEANYRRLLEIVSDQYSLLFGVEPQEVLTRFQRDLGYVTCKVGVNAAVFREGKILLEQRKDDGCWGIPGGWVDVNETPQQAIEREMREETSLTIQTKQIIGFFSRVAGQFGQPHSSCHILYLCVAETGELKKSHESLALGFFGLDEIREWHRDHRAWAESAFACRI